MFEALAEFMEIVWGIPLMTMMVAVGLYFSVRMKLFQFLHLGYIYRNTIGTLIGKHARTIEGEGQIKSFHAVSAVLAGTVGAGSIAGVASAIAIGGPGAVFWMWVISFFGMATKMVEVTLAVYYRKKGQNGEYYGGPMHYIQDGIGKKWRPLALLYAVALLLLVVTDACFVQTNTMATALNDVFGVPLLATGLVAVAISIIIVLGGVERIGQFCGYMVPPMCLLYIVGAGVVLIANIQHMGEALGMIFQYAFAPAPAAGGFVGSTIMMAMSRGAARGIFSNEAGMGTATTVHATAHVDHPIRQGMWGCVEVFIVTMIVCNLTAFAILTSGVLSSGETGAVLTFSAFRTVWGPFGMVVVCIATVLFTYSSFLGFFIEFRTAVNFLCGEKIEKFVKWLYFIPPIIAVTMPIEAVWTMADMAVGFLVVPNVIAIFMLRKTFIALFHDFMQRDKEGTLGAPLDRSRIG